MVKPSLEYHACRKNTITSPVPAPGRGMSAVSILSWKFPPLVSAGKMENAVTRIYISARRFAAGFIFFRNFEKFFSEPGNSTELSKFFQKFSPEIKPDGLLSALILVRRWTAAKGSSVRKENAKEEGAADGRRVVPDFQRYLQKGNGMKCLFYGAVHESID